MSRPSYVSDSTERALQRHLDHLQRAIDQTLAALRWVNQGSIGDNGPFSVRYVNNMPSVGFSELSKPAPGGIRKDLRDHLRLLLKQRQGEIAAFNRHHGWLQLKVLKQRKAKQTTVAATPPAPVLKRPGAPVSVNASGLTPELEAQWRQLKAEANKNLHRSLDTLLSQPSARALDSTLAGIREMMLLGEPVSTGTVARAMNAVQTITARQALGANAAYLANPSRAGLTALAGWVEKAYAVGCSIADFQPAYDTLARIQ